MLIRSPVALLLNRPGQLVQTYIKYILMEEKRNEKDY